MNHRAPEKTSQVGLSALRKEVAQPLRPHGQPARHATMAGASVNAGQDCSAKLTLASRLNELLDERGLSQSAAAQLLGMPQPKVSAIRNYKLRGISLERLMQALLSLNQQVEIIVKPGRKAGGGSIRVAA